VYCPKCRAEYREGFTECSDCRVPLVWELPPESTGPGNPDLEWVSVFDGDDPLIIASAKELLERAGIPFYVVGDEIGARHAVIGEYIHPWRRICVGRDREAEARAILEQFEEVDSTSDRPE